MTKKFNYKLPSMVALTLFGTAFTAHHAHAAEETQDQTKNSNVLDDQATLKQAEQAKNEVTQSAQNVSGTQTYQDPTKVQSKQDTTSNNYDASLDELNDSSSKASQQEQSNNSNQPTDSKRNKYIISQYISRFN